MSSVVLHIGTKKTGTTFLQSFLSRNQDALADQGWRCPTLVGRRGHHDLALAFATNKNSPWHKLHGQDSPAATEQLIGELGGFLGRSVQPDDRWVLSSEFIGSRVSTPADVGALLALLHEHFDDVRVLVYFRRQDFMVPSTYSQSIKEGSRATLDWQYVDRRIADFDHLGLFTMWCDAAGAQSVAARPFLEGYKAQPEALLADFLDAAGIATDPAFVLPGPAAVNPQLAAEGVAALRVVNAVLPRRGSDGKPMRRALSPRIARGIAAVNEGPSIALPRDLAQQIDHHFDPSNRALINVMGMSDTWSEWLAQDAKPTTEQPRPTVPNERLAQLLFAASAVEELFPPVLLARLTARMSVITDWSDPAGYASLDRAEGS